MHSHKNTAQCSPSGERNRWCFRSFTCMCVQFFALACYPTQSSALTRSCRAGPAPPFVPLLQLKASLKRSFHQGLQPLLKATQQIWLWFNLCPFIAGFVAYVTVQQGVFFFIFGLNRQVRLWLFHINTDTVLNELTLSSSSCCLLFSSTAALRSSSFCLCSSSRLQRSSTVRSYWSRALRSFSLISCSLAADTDDHTHYISNTGSQDVHKVEIKDVFFYLATLIWSIL